MPGLSQLKQFNKDMLAIGDELNKRASRGEHPVRVPIPKTIKDVDDSNDFILGMPENELENEEAPIDNDLSDIFGSDSISGKGENSEKNAGNETEEQVDLSALLNPMEGLNVDGNDVEMPDLSAFEEPVETSTEDADSKDSDSSENDVPDEPKPVSIADMGLEDLLSGTGFDGSDISEIPDAGFNSSLNGGDYYTDEELEQIAPPEKHGMPGNLHDRSSFNMDFDDLEDVEELDLINEEPVLDEKSDFTEEPVLDEKSDFTEKPVLDEKTSENASQNSSEVEEKIVSAPFDFGKIDISSIPDVDPEHALEPLNEFDFPDENFQYETPPAPKASEELDNILGNVEDISAPAVSSEFDDLDLDNIEDLGIDVDNQSHDKSEKNDSENKSDLFDDVPEIGDKKSDGESEAIGTLNEIGELEDLEELDDYGDLEPLEEVKDDSKLDSMDSLSPLDDIDDLFSESSDSKDSETLQNPDENEDSFDFNVPDFQDKIPDISDDSGNSDIFATGLDDIDNMADFSMPSNENAGADSDNADGDDNAGNANDFNFANDSGDNDDLFGSIDLDDLDFSTGTTSEKNSGNDSGSMDFSNLDGNGFELGNTDDFAFEGDDFEIAGYTDVDIAKEEKKSPVLPTPDFSGAIEGTKLPPNTLSDEQYRQFTENLQTYPLNVRLAFEDLIVRDEFTDDAEFEIIEKVINKVPARQLAATLEKMLDISLPVPRDFEHRTASEYEAYKHSLQYQLRNKIIPISLIVILCFLLGTGLFHFVRNCIYFPAKAASLYKQGYALLEADEYPQSEIKFNEAVEYKVSKKWFFNYARGYRAHKQYQRAEDMYDNILKRFKHDKEAGLEYANMELQDIGNYPKAEEIVRRQVLDWHINDPDGLLTLGDTFLEWATEKDPSKFEDARQQYATLLNLYGSKSLYLSRMMRYFVRTDNLQQVLQLKSVFDGNKKFKYDSADITELSGYLLDKVYGHVTPAEESLKNRIEGVRGLLLTAVKSNPDNPEAWYNLSRYYINTRETGMIERALQRTIQEFNDADTLRAKDIHNYIDSYRLLGEYYVGKEDYLKAQEQYTEGLSLYTTERDNAGFAGTEKIGHLYSDLADINYFVSSEYKQALSNYEHAVNLKFDNPQIRYRIGYIQYRNRNYAEALSSFMKASEGNVRHKNLMLAMANTLSMRGDDYAASGYYESLISILDRDIADEGLVFPQASAKHNDLINNYLYASNNYGVTLHRLAVRTGDSALNAEAIVQFQQSVRAWDALTRNQESMVRLEGSNLALENIRYITHPFSDFEPAIYTDIKKVLTDAEGIR